MQLIDMQLKHNDCGVSVIKTVCNILKVDICRSHIEQHLCLDAQGSRFSDIKQFFDRHGFEAVPQLLDLNLKDEKYYNARVPFILPVEKRGRAHYVVVTGCKRGRFEILDPLENAPYHLSLGELRKYAYIADTPLSGFALKDQALVVCQRLLLEYGFEPDSVQAVVPPDRLFNKIVYFLHIRDGFGFRDTEAERSFLEDLLFNQDMAWLPRQFELLTIAGNTATVRAPVILPVRRNSQVPAVTLPGQGGARRNVFLVLYDALGRHRNNVVLFVCIALASVSFTQLYVFINQYFLDEILDLKNITVLSVFLLGLTGYFVLDFGLYIWKKWLAVAVSIKLDRLFLSSFDEKLNHFSLAFIQGYKKGDLAERLSDATKLKSFFTRYLVNILVDSAVSVYILAVLLYFDWRLTLIVLLVMGAFYLWFRCITPYLQRNEQIRFSRKSDLFSTMLEKMEGIQTLKCLGYDRAFSGKIMTDIDNLLAIQAKTQKLNVVNSGVTLLITTAAKLLLIWLLAYASAVRGMLSLGEVVTFLTLSSRVFSSLGGLLDENLTVQENAIILKRYLNFQEPGPAKACSGMPLHGPLESITIDNIFFGYHPAEPILERLSITINRGDTIRIEGRNGSGKSTLSKVLALLYPIQAGSILINGSPLKNFAADAVRKKILLVSNEDTLFNDTVLYNLTFQNSEWDERIDVFAEKLGLTGWIREMRARGSAYEISESGRNLSTGQRKKLIILRALLHPAEFVIFDEVLSGIDAASRDHIEKYLDTINDKTFIFISHEHIEHIRFNKVFAIVGKSLVTRGASGGGL